MEDKNIIIATVGLSVVLDNDGNMILTEGLVFREERFWTKFAEKDIIPKNNHCELYLRKEILKTLLKNMKDYFPTLSTSTD